MQVAKTGREIELEGLLARALTWWQEARAEAKLDMYPEESRCHTECRTILGLCEPSVAITSSSPEPSTMTSTG